MKKTFKFFEFIARMGSMLRWSLMRNVKQEDLKQHSYDVAVTAHALTIIRNEKVLNPFRRRLDPNLAATYALFHDTAEVFTGDIPTPIKQFGGGKVKAITEVLEQMAVEKMVSSLPEELQENYRHVFLIPKDYKDIIKAADQISALRKCREEIAAGNKEFLPAAARLEETLESSNRPEVRYYLENFLPDKPMTLDSLIEGNGAWLLEEEPS